jgi:serine/threonine protein kinase
VIPGYNVLRKLGQGGAGAVYLAEHIRLGRQAAIKVLNPSLARDPTILSRFASEAQNASRIRHPNVCMIYDFVETSNQQAFIVMEYIEGETLGQVLRRSGAFDPQDAGRIVQQVSVGLQAAHDVGIVHRDLKPSNVMIGRSGNEDIVRVLDFGIAKALQQERDDALTRTGFLIGTPQYMSPEQLTGQPVDLRSDIYALGLLAFEMLAGTTAFRQPLDRLTQPPLRLHSLRPDLDLAAAQEVLDRALAARPEDRWPTAQDFGIALLGALDAPAAGWSAAGKRARLMDRVISWFRSTPDALDRPGAPQKEQVHQNKEEGAPAGQGTIVPGIDTEQEQTLPAPAPLPAGLDDATRVDWAPRQLPEEAQAEFEGEHTRMFVPRGVAGGGSDHTRAPAAPGEPPKAGSFPVALTITKCSDSQRIGLRVRCAHFPFVVGRSEEAHLSIPSDAALSRQHLSIDADESGFFVRDLSTNGIYINGRRVVGTVAPLDLEASISLSQTTSLAFVADVSPPPDLTGKQVGGRFQLERRLHASIKAATYFGHDIRAPRRPLVIKLFSPGLMRLGRYREEFEREAKLAAELKHPHICKVLEFGEVTATIDASAEQLTFLILEYMEGGNLTEHRDSASPDLRTLARWIEKIASALHHAHRKGVVHGNLKPACIVFDADGTPYLTDFAMAAGRNYTGVAAGIGTPAYMAPERWHGDPPSEASDQYALAALAYLMVTGVRPFEGQSIPEVRERNFQRGAAPLHEEAERQGRQGVPPAISAVVAKAMSIDPGERYDSVIEFWRAFELALAERRQVERPLRVFMSYQRESSAAWAILFARSLQERHGCSVFVDTQSRDGAPQIPERIRNEIAGCDVFACLLAPSTLASRWVRQEVQIAHDLGKPMVPIFHEDYRSKDDQHADTPAILRLLEFDAVHLMDRRNIYVDNAIAELGSRINRLVRG